MENQDYITPVLYVTFYRHEYARKSFDAIKAAKPRKLFFYSNAARLDRPNEVEGNRIIRSFVDEIDWECELHTYFRETYVDMVESHEGAYGWVFKTEKQLIAIDDDCIASKAFFTYCETLLNLYADNKQIWLISGDNFTPDYYTSEYDITFSRYGHLFGWGTWKDRWEKFPRRVNDWNKKKYKPVFQNYYSTKKEVNFQLNRFDSYFKRTYPKHPIWDFLMFLEIIKTNGLTIIPKLNLANNIGVIGDHNPGEDYYFYHLPYYSKEKYSLNSLPLIIKPDNFYDLMHLKNHWLTTQNNSIYYRIKRKLKTILR